MIYQVLYQGLFACISGLSHLYDQCVYPLVNFPTLLALLAISLAAAFAYIKVRHPFWNLQPVFHTYDLYRKYCCFSPYVPLLNSDPRRRHKQKFHDDLHVKTGKYLDMRDIDSITAEVADFLQAHGNVSDRIFYKMSPVILKSCLAGHSDAVLISTYRETRGHPSPLLGCMFSRPVFFYLHAETLKVHFWDFMCVSRTLLTQKRKNEVVRKLIQTHAYNQADLVPNIHISLFRKEIDLCDGVRPCVTFQRHSLFLGTPTKTAAAAAAKQQILLGSHHLILLGVRPDNIHVLADFLADAAAATFAFRVVPDMATILAAITNKHIFVYYLYCVQTHRCIAFYFFRNSYIQYEDYILRDAAHFDAAADCDALHLFASYRSAADNVSSQNFNLGFLNALHELQTLYPAFHVLWIDALSHNTQILYDHKNNAPSSIACAYYFYNYIIPQSPHRQESTFILLF